MDVVRDKWDLVSHSCFRLFPCLSDPVGRSDLGLRLALVFLHLMYLGVLLVFDKEFVHKFTTDPWYVGLYLLLFVAALAQYFFTSCTSPGYVLDAMRDVNEGDTLCRGSSVASKQPASSKDVNVIITVDGSNGGRSIMESNGASWTKLVMGLYPPGSSSSSLRNWTCTYCNIVQPPRSKHCHDCDKCVLQFDHHCIWLGTCIGQGNHCRFWWYLFEETGLCLWTGILYMAFLKSNVPKSWYVYLIVVLLLATLSVFLIFLLLLLIFHSYLVITNQTTYELVRRRRIPYLRNINQRVYPFSKGVCRNVYNFCCNRRSTYLEPMPTAEELEEKSRPYTCLDVLSCRCC
ncbi:protein modifying enzyme [Lithospermum erythrorhizon]|uniref:S-acyltransferase n=1 Tax=Lithospermum erythrorhizon TaxID=34254 RepID=A0AAV3P2M4_LITER